MTFEKYNIISTGLKPRPVSVFRILSLRSLKALCWQSSLQGLPMWLWPSLQVGILTVMSLWVTPVSSSWWWWWLSAVWKSTSVVPINYDLQFSTRETSPSPLCSVSSSISGTCWKEWAHSHWKPLWHGFVCWFHLLQVPAFWEMRPVITMTRWAPQWTAPMPPARSAMISPSVRREAAHLVWWMISR